MGWESRSLRIKTGTYVGDGAVNRAVTGIGFTPRIVRVTKGAVGDAKVWVRMKAFPINYSEYHRAGTDSFVTQGIRTMNDDGFVVSAGLGNFDPNTNGQDYYYICWE